MDPNLNDSVELEQVVGLRYRLDVEHEIVGELLNGGEGIPGVNPAGDDSFLDLSDQLGEQWGRVGGVDDHFHLGSPGCGLGGRPILSVNIEIHVVDAELSEAHHRQ